MGTRRRKNANRQPRTDQRQLRRSGNILPSAAAAESSAVALPCGDTFDRLSVAVLSKSKGGDLGRRIERVRRGLYGLYADLCYFKTCPPAHRERLRRELDWPDVGHITSLARALAEEERFSDWVRFNRLTKSA